MQLQVESIIKQMFFKQLLSKNVSALDPFSMQILISKRIDELVRRLETENQVEMFNFYCQLIQWGDSYYLPKAEQAIEKMFFTADQANAYLKLYHLRPENSYYLEQAESLSKKLFFAWDEKTTQLVWTPEAIAKLSQKYKTRAVITFRQTMNQDGIRIALSQDHEKNKPELKGLGLHSMVNPQTLFTIRQSLKYIHNKIEHGTEYEIEDRKALESDIGDFLFKETKLYFEAAQVYLIQAANNFDYLSKAAHCALLLKRDQKYFLSYQIYRELAQLEVKYLSKIILMAARSFKILNQFDYAAHLFAFVFKYTSSPLAKIELESILDKVPFGERKLEIHAILAKRGSRDSVQYLIENLAALKKAGYYDELAFLSRLLIGGRRLSALAIQTVHTLDYEGQTVLAYLLLLELYESGSPYVTINDLSKWMRRLPQKNVDPVNEFIIWERFINLTTQINSH